MPSFQSRLFVFLLIFFASRFATAIPNSLQHSNILQRSNDLREEYDYIIIGEGTSGLTVADRLTEDGQCKLSSATHLQRKVETLIDSLHRHGPRD